MTENSMRGVIAAVPTPVTDTGDPDLERFLIQCHWALNNGCNGLKDSSGDLDYARSLRTQLPELDIFPSDESVLFSIYQCLHGGSPTAHFFLMGTLEGHFKSINS